LFEHPREITKDEIDDYDEDDDCDKTHHRAFSQNACMISLFCRLSVLIAARSGAK
jgi:hypothetical protein